MASLKRPGKRAASGPAAGDADAPAKNTKIWDMMGSMGYTSDKGLGREGQGRIEPVGAIGNVGRSGFGAAPKELQFDSSKVWDYEEDEAPLVAEVNWLDSSDDVSLPERWEEGPRSLNIENETKFCEPSILQGVLQAKTVFDSLPSRDLNDARFRSNVYEHIGKGIFQNRAAMKMAELDATLEWIFSGGPNLEENARGEMRFFGDVCAGPGGFSEYILWRRKGRAKGYGFTLRGDCDFKLLNFVVAPSQFLEPYYGADDDGDVYKVENQQGYSGLVERTAISLAEREKAEREKTVPRGGLHFVMADGGFSVEGQENVQEILSKRLYLCQFLVALLTLREGGHFVCKVFDLFTPFSVSLIYLMRSAFQKFAIIKPVTSRPANSERYVVCRDLWRRLSIDDPLVHLLSQANQRLGELDGTDRDITELVSVDEMRQDEGFIAYIEESNNQIGSKQILGLQKIAHFSANKGAYDQRQADTRDACLERWGCDATPVTRGKGPAARRNLRNWNDPALFLQEKDIHSFHNLRQLTEPDLSQINLLNYRAIPMGNSEPVWLISLGGENVYTSQVSSSPRWVKVKEQTYGRLDLPYQTLLLAAPTEIFKGEGNGQLRLNSLLVIDAVRLVDRDVSTLELQHRRAEATVFASAIDRRETRKQLTILVVPPLVKGENLHKMNVKLIRVKNRGAEMVACIEVQPGFFMVVASAILLKLVKKPWNMQWSKGHGKKYFFNHATGVSSFETPADLVAASSFDAISEGFLIPSNLLANVKKLSEKQDPLTVISSGF